MMNMDQNVIRHDAIDSMVFDNLLEHAPALKAVVDSGDQQLKTFGALSSDVFFSLYKPSPEIRSDVASECLFNKEQLTKLMDSGTYKAIREYTVLDELSAGLGSKALLESLIRQIQEDPSLKQLVNKTNHATVAKQAAEEFSAASKESKAKMESVKEATDDVKHILAAQQSNLRRAMERAAGHAVEEAEAVSEVITSWGLNKGGFERLPVERKLALLSVLRDQKKFKAMGKLVGRLRNIAIASRKIKVDQARVELHSITVGNDIFRLLPQELVALRKPALKLDFYRRLAERQLAQYDLRHNEPKGQGPVIVLVDTSGSMRKDTREEWSKAVVLGLAEIAAREKRAFAYVLFAGPGDDLITDEFTRGYPVPEQLLKLAESFIGGGTDFEKPLKHAIKKINESKYANADVVMITDGECAIDDTFFSDLKKAKESKGFRIYSVLIGGTPHEINRWSDEVWAIHDLLDDHVVNELFQRL